MQLLQPSADQDTLQTAQKHTSQFPFDDLDTNRDGVIDKSEFRAAMSHKKVQCPHLCLYDS